MKREIMLPASARWGVFLISAVVMFVITALVMNIVTHATDNARSQVLTASLLQGFLVFILPTMFAWRLTSSHPWQLSGLSVVPGWLNIAWMLLFYAMAYPALNQIIWWNQNMQLPESMAGLETSMRAMEDTAAAATEQVLGTTSAAAMLVNVLIIGIFTGFAEECFFRAGMQRMMHQSGMNACWAIWITAIVFSSVHFQFYGFVPRMLLGAMFGYVYYKTGSIWPSAIMHALNNSLVVVFTWLQQINVISTDTDTLFVTESGLPWPMIASTLLTIAFIYTCMKGKTFHCKFFRYGKQD